MSIKKQELNLKNLYVKRPSTAQIGSLNSQRVVQEYQLDKEMVKGQKSIDDDSKAAETGRSNAEQTTLGNQQESKESAEKMLNNRHCQSLLEDVEEALPTPSYYEEDEVPIEQTFFIERPMDNITQISRLESEHCPSVAQLGNKVLGVVAKKPTHVRNKSRSKSRSRSKSPY